WAGGVKYTKLVYELDSILLTPWVAREFRKKAAEYNDAMDRQFVAVFHDADQLDREHRNALDFSWLWLDWERHYMPLVRQVPGREGTIELDSMMKYDFLQRAKQQDFGLEVGDDVEGMVRWGINRILARTSGLRFEGYEDLRRKDPSSEIPRN